LETESGWLVYTGDLRLRGKRGKQTREFIERASQLKPTVLLCEGTNVGANSPTASEEEIYSRALTAVKQARGLVIADFGPRNVERLTTFHQIAQETSRQLVILSKDAYLLEAMRLASSEIPNLAQDNFISIYEDTKAQLSGWEKKVRTKYQNKLLTPREISQHQPDYILCFSFFDINKLSSILPKEGSLYLYSSSEVYDEEGALDMERLHNWLDHFGIDRLGLPRKEEIGWEVPQDERGLHASGHASEAELIELIKDLSPKMLIPIHTQKPDYFIELLRDTDIKVHLPKYRERLNF
jgi:ribonuclease J